MSNKNLRTVSAVSKMGALGDVSHAAMVGFNHRFHAQPFQKHIEHQGLTFFTRPDLNFSYYNLANHRKMSLLLDNSPNSLYSAIRTLLDPRGNHTSFVDNKQAFIPIMTNTLTALSAPPDFALDTFVSDEGLNKQNYSMVDGGGYNQSAFNFEATFKNLRGNPITMMMVFWTLYPLLLRRTQNGMVKYPQNIVANRIDYQSRVFRLKLDVAQQYVVGIGSYNVCYPLSPAYSELLAFNESSPFTENLDEVTIPFAAVGFDYMDPVLVWEFNRVVQVANPQMANRIGMIKLSNTERDAFNYIGYPHIASDMELEWWVTSEQYGQILRRKENLITELTGDKAGPNATLMNASTGYQSTIKRGMS